MILDLNLETSSEGPHSTACLVWAMRVPWLSALRRTCHHPWHLRQHLFAKVDALLQLNAMHLTVSTVGLLNYTVGWQKVDFTNWGQVMVVRICAIVYLYLLLCVNFDLLLNISCSDPLILTRTTIACRHSVALSLWIEDEDKCYLANIESAHFTGKLASGLSQNKVA